MIRAIFAFVLGLAVFLPAGSGATANFGCARHDLSNIAARMKTRGALDSTRPST